MNFEPFHLDVDVSYDCSCDTLNVHVNKIEPLTRIVVSTNEVLDDFLKYNREAIEKFNEPGEDVYLIDTTVIVAFYVRPQTKETVCHIVASANNAQVTSSVVLL